MKKYVLIVEDDTHVVELLSWHLHRAGFDVDSTPDGEQALGMAVKRKPDLILLDWMLERSSGIEVCRRLRHSIQIADVPVIMLTARSEEIDRVRGFEAGADDYVTKPFSPSEVVARVHAVLRRSRSEPLTVLRYMDVQMEVENYRVRRSGKNIDLSPTEFKLLRFLMENPEKVFSRERLLSAVWEHEEDITPRTVDVHILRLRKLLNAGKRRDLFRTVRSGGYALDASD